MQRSKANTFVLREKTSMFERERNIPEKVKSGITWRRVKNFIRDPMSLIRNFRFLVNNVESKENHIFVVGPPRSGTTLIKNVIQSHPKICGIEKETFFFMKKNYKNLEIGDLKKEKLESIKRKASSVSEFFDGVAEVIKNKNGKNILVEKTPSHALKLGYILNTFPKSRVVFAVRDPRDGFASAKRNPKYMHSLPSGNQTEAYANQWKISVKKYVKYKGSNQICLVKYESFCKRPYVELKNIHKLLSVKANKMQLRTESYSSNSVSDQKGHSRLEEPISARTVGSWKSELKEREVSIIKKIAKKWMRKIGYKTESIVP
jgi:hypothetical protein